jgi:hypothetical protein
MHTAQHEKKEQEKGKGGREEQTAHAVRALFGSPGARIPTPPAPELKGQ